MEERSALAWSSINFIADHREEFLNLCTPRLKCLQSLDEALERCEYWFFQRRDHFMSQSRFPKWSAASLDSYVLIPVAHGFTNNKECFFVSHFWRTPEHPDPNGIDLSLLQGALREEEWSYIWVDYSCLPQVPRTAAEECYFKSMLKRIPALVQDCAFVGAFPAFESRAWVLYEVATFVLDHNFGGPYGDDMLPFVSHVHEMVEKGVGPTLKNYGYKCTNDSDLALVTAWLEILVILCRNVKAPTSHQRTSIRQQIMGDLYKNCSLLNYVFLGVTVDKASGILTIDGTTHKFTPIPGLDLAQDGVDLIICEP
ncbi:hypothetical protein BG004_000114 [Podila humilis]|nr:hypothetical protein BG004_000114 [Podila humilis]